MYVWIDGWMVSVPHYVQLLIPLQRPILLINNCHWLSESHHMNVKVNVLFNSANLNVILIYMVCVTFSSIRNDLCYLLLWHHTEVEIRILQSSLKNVTSLDIIVAIWLLFCIIWTSKVNGKWFMQVRVTLTEECWFPALRM